MSICNIEISEYVHKSKLNQYFDLLKRCNGRVLQPSFVSKRLKQENIMCHVGFDKNEDYTRFYDAWNRINTSIIEKDNRTYIKTKLNNLKFLFKKLFRG